MNLEKLVAISGFPGVFKAVTERKNGVIVKSLESGKAKFIPSRRHEIHNLQAIGIYQDDGETMELRHVFRNMLQQIEDNPPISSKSSAEELREYFREVMPNHDEDKVHISDIKKVIKWFNFLNETGYMVFEDEEEEAASEHEQEGLTSENVQEAEESQEKGIEEQDKEVGEDRS